MLARAGLEWEAAYGDYQGTPYAAISRGMLVVARKPGGPSQAESEVGG